MHPHPIRIVVIGGVAAGASFAARARRLCETARITVVERGPDVSFANCGLPYHVGGEIEAREALAVQTPATLRAMLDLDVRVLAEAVRIDAAGRTVTVRSVRDGTTEVLPYDALMLAPGAVPVVPPLPGVEHPRVATLRHLGDMDRIGAAAADARSAVVVGAGFIGLELAEQLRRRGLHVTLVEREAQVLPPMDAALTRLLEDELRREGVDLRLGEGIAGFADGPDGSVVARLASGAEIAADFAVLSIGVRPETGLAREAGLALGPRGHIVVDGFQRTSVPGIYAAGDAVQTADRIDGGPVSVALGGPANRQGRVAADHLFLGERARPYPGSLGTAIVRAFSVAAGLTGWSAKRLRAAGRPFRATLVNDHQHAGYFPGAKPILLEILWDPADGRVLGAQATGFEGVDKRLDVLATAIAGGATIEDLAHLELAYAPPFGSAKDIVNLAGFAALNERDGLVDFVHALPEPGAAQLVDVRPAALAAAHPVPGATVIPLAELRRRLGELDPARPVVTVCALGKTSYFAARILRQRGFADVRALVGGIRATLDPRTPSKPPGR